MSKHTFEIRQREANEHRGPRDGYLGFFTILIDGVETEYYNNPMKAWEPCLKQALLEGKAPGGEATTRALALCEERAIHCLNRIVQHIQEGSLIPGGVPLGAKGLDLSQVPGFKDESGTPSKKPKRRDESTAVEAFVNRGHLSHTIYQLNDRREKVIGSNGKPVVLRREPLTSEERKARKAQRDERRDHIDDWKHRRAALIERRLEELAGLEKEAIDNPGKAHKLERSIDAIKHELALLTAPVLAASHGFQYAYGEYLAADIDLVADDIRIVPCMTNTTVDTERDAKDMVSDFTTVDEFDGAGYSTGGQALDNQAVNIDDANDRAEFDADDEAATLSAGTRSIQGNLLIKFDTTLNNSVPLHWIEYAANKTPDGSTFTVVFNAEGILQAADG